MILLEPLMKMVLGDKIFNFRLQWGIVDVVSNEELQALIAGHTYGRNDLDSEGKTWQNKTCRSQGI